MFRVTWDLTYAGPTPVKGQVVWGYTGGVKAPPGEYTVRLTANGVTMAHAFRLLADPRLTTLTQADYEEQFRLGSAIRDSINVVQQALETIRAVREQAQRAVEQAARISQEGVVRPAVDSLTGKLGGVELEFSQVKSQSGQDPIRFAGKLDNQLMELYGFVTGSDGYIAGGPKGRPAPAAAARLADLGQALAPVSGRLRTILERDVAALNELLKRLGLGGIVLPRAPVM
jgi:hypothetical protein